MSEHHLIDIHVLVRRLERLGAGAHRAVHLRVETHILERFTLQAERAELAVDVRELLFVDLLPCQCLFEVEELE